MNKAVIAISTALKIDLEGIVKQLVEKERFLACCEAFVEQTDFPIEALQFFTHLRRNGFPGVAKAICQFLFVNNPGALCRSQYRSDRNRSTPSAWQSLYHRPER